MDWQSVRILPFLETSGTEQMQHDTHWLHWVEEQTEPCLLVRFYRFNPACLSVGKHQSFTPEDLERYQLHYQLPDLDWVRRPTGGRALLHHTDLAFAFVTNHPEVLRRSVADSYCIFSKLIQNSLLTLGVGVDDVCQESVSQRAYTRSSLCLETRTASDLQLNGQKVVAAAQSRTKSGVLQHGSIQLALNEQDLTQALLQEL
jgi:lipoate-protein ligase A